ncbi:hypothetical protein DEIPH_ctg013orf0019 [Deinococcus phoenicis]|uniref:Uncharacterized protein n=1 Tax=Deinococcus phoenicis TaxID=1476583 RepID=A0A016QSE6_9DEIO|nr:hypothetical protein [Deinococcus phoenicis]EYB68916.1 hypothetical protein DEIPH_ctg013orf0019 [Deinococcus phoenicis]
MIPRPSPYRHVRKRLWQRYRLRLKLDEYHQLCHALATGHCPSVLLDGYPEGRRVLIRFRYARRHITAIWDNDSRLLVTCLPPSTHARAHHALGTLT